MDNSEHAELLGGLVGNFQSLEIAIRLAMAQRHDSVARNTYGDDFRNAPVGTVIALSDLTDFASLRDLINGFNSAFSPEKPLDLSLVTLRDALAHGRVFAGPSEEEFRIVKFTKPAKGATNVAVEYSEVMTKGWFTENKARVRQAVEIVALHLSSRSN